METSSFVSDNDLGSLQNAGLVEETSSAELSLDLLTTPKSDLKTTESKFTTATGREALQRLAEYFMIGYQRQINLLEQGNREQIANANAKYRAYQDKIEYLESVVSNLKLDREGIDKATEMESKTKSLQNALDEKERKVKALSKQNEKLLQDNKELRAECSKLKSTLDVYGQNIDLDTETSTSRAIPKHISAEVGRILNTKQSSLPKSYAPRQQEESTQTNNDDYYDADMAVELQKTSTERDQLRQSFQIEKDLNHELVSTIHSFRSEISQLESNLTTLSNDLELALASERLATDKLEANEILIRERNLQISELTETFNNLHHEYSILQKNYIIAKTENETYDKQRQAQKIDPLLFLESQWTKDRTEFYQETTALKGSLQFLQSENNKLREQIDSKMEGYPDMEAYAEMVANHSLMTDKLRQVENELSVKEGACTSLVAQVLKLETILDSKERGLKDNNQQIALLRKDIARKGALIQEQADKISVFEKTTSIQEQRAKFEGSLMKSKDHVIKDLKQKVKDLKQSLEKMQLESTSIKELQNTLKETKAEMQRKGELLKFWKDKAADLESRLNKLAAENKELVDAKQVSHLQAQLRVARGKTAKLTDTVNRYQLRELQFVNVLEQFVQGSQTLIAQSPAPFSDFGMDQSEITEMAASISKEILHMDWKDLNIQGPPEFLNLTGRLKEILEKEEFERELYDLLTETLAL